MANDPSVSQNAMAILFEHLSAIADDGYGGKRVTVFHREDGDMFSVITTFQDEHENGVLMTRDFIEQSIPQGVRFTLTKLFIRDESGGAA